MMTGNQAVYVVIISADTEWEYVKEYFCKYIIQRSPFGEWFTCSTGNESSFAAVINIFHGGWGKVSAAASTQYVIDQWKPKLVINLGTCGGLTGEIDIGEILLVNKTIIYDIYEQMGDPEDHIRYYSTDIDVSWLDEPYPIAVKSSLLVSGDRDLLVNDIPTIKNKYHAVAGDWESGAIAWVAKMNNIPCLIIRGVTDLVSSEGGEAYNGNIGVFIKNTEMIMKKLLMSLPDWINKFNQHAHKH